MQREDWCCHQASWRLNCQQRIETQGSVHDCDFLCEHTTYSRRQNAHKNVTFSKYPMHFQPFKGLKFHKFSGGACPRTPPPPAYDCLHVCVQSPPPPAYDCLHVCVQSSTSPLQNTLCSPCNLVVTYIERWAWHWQWAGSHCTCKLRHLPALSPRWWASPLGLPTVPLVPAATWWHSGGRHDTGRQMTQTARSSQSLCFVPQWEQLRVDLPKGNRCRSSVSLVTSFNCFISGFQLNIQFRKPVEPPWLNGHMYMQTPTRQHRAQQKSNS